MEKLVESAPMALTLDKAIASQFTCHKTANISNANYPGHVRRVLQGCVYTSDGEKVSLSERVGGVGGDHVLSDNPVCYSEESPQIFLPGKTLYLGYFMSHYGHFVTEFLSRCWCNDIGGIERIAVYPFIFGVSIQKFHRYFLESLFGKDVLDLIYVIKKPVIFEQVVVPEQLIVYNQRANKQALSLYESLTPAESSPIKKRRLFLSRSNSLKNRRLENIDEVESVFREYGFEVIYPEEITIENQIKCYASASVLAGLSGSAMHNVLFGRSCAQLIEVGDIRAKKGFLKMQHILNVLKGVDARHISYKEGTRKRCIDIGYLQEGIEAIL